MTDDGERSLDSTNGWVREKGVWRYAGSVQGSKGPGEAAHDQREDYEYSMGGVVEPPVQGDATPAGTEPTYPAPIYTVVAPGRDQRWAKILLVVGMVVVVAAVSFKAALSVEKHDSMNQTQTTLTTLPALTSGERSALLQASQVVEGSLVDINSTFGAQLAAGAGTGMVISSSGLVVTNNHVVAQATALSVTVVGSGATYPAKVVGYDRTDDVAVIQIIGASGLTPVKFGKAALVGEPIIGIGNAGGVGGAPTASPGIVTALNQSITAGDSLTGTKEQLHGLILTNAGIKPGDSGGPLVNQTGEVVGMDTAALVGTATTTGSGYSIPISEVQSIEAAITSGKGGSEIHLGPTAYLGILTSTKTPGVGGVLIAGLVANSPAKAKLAVGDLVTKIDGRPTPSVSALATVVGSYKPGTSVSVTWTQHGATHQTTVRLGTGPAQ
jgi:S1-C subfamily serine protease